MKGDDMKKTILALVVLLQGVSTLSAVQPSVEVIHKNEEISLLKKRVAALKENLKLCHAQVANVEKMHKDCLHLVERAKAVTRAEINRIRAQLAGVEGEHH